MLVLMSATLTVCYSSVAFSVTPPTAPSLYDTGPASPLYAVTDLSNAEKAAYALYEAVFNVAQAKVHATSCSSSEGSYAIDVFTNGLQETDPDRINTVTVTSMGGEFRLEANIKEQVIFRGQKVYVVQDGAGELDGKTVGTYSGVSSYNDLNNMVLVDGYANIKNISGRFSAYRSSMIKDFFHGEGNEAYFVFGWGTELLYKLGYPVSKYWDRAKSRRSDGQIGRTVMVKDRLIGPTSCRIMIDTQGYNNEDIFWQYGNLFISISDPAEPLSEFDDF